VADRRRAVFARLLIIVFTAAAVFAIGVRYPYYNWDIVGYVAAAYHQDGLRGDALRDRTFDDVKNEVGPGMFQHLTEGPYRQTVYEDSRALEQQVPFYTVKIGYLVLVRVAGRLGLSYAQSTFWVSALFSALSVVVIGMITQRVQLSPLVVPLVAFGAGHSEVARGSLPDAPACFLALIAVYFALGRSRWLYVVSALLPLMRTDYVIFSALLMTCRFLSGERRYALTSLLASVAAYVGVSAAWGGYGWLKLFNFTLITGASPYPLEAAVSSRLVDYLTPFGRIWGQMIQGHFFVIYCIALFAIIALLRGRLSMRDRGLLFMLPFAFVVLHLLFFPLYEDRFFVFSASLMLVGIFVLLGRAGTIAADRVA